MTPAADDRPVQLLVTVDDRLRKVEQTLDRLSRPGDGPPGFSPAALMPYVVPAGATTTGGLWGRVPILHELRLMLGMYFDPRYRLSRPGQFGIPGVLGVMFLNYLFLGQLIAIPLLPFLLPLLERLLLVVLAVVLYKLLSREAARYDAVLRYLAQHGR